MKMLDLWYLRFDASSFANQISQKGIELLFGSSSEAPKSKESEFLLSMLKNNKGQFEIIETPPLILHPKNISEIMENIQGFHDQYHRTLEDDENILLEKFELKDVVFKVMGVGSVGIRCYVCLMMNENEEPLYIQVKEAQASVLEQFTQPSVYQNHGERVAKGQRFLQSVCDLFLGWCIGPEGKHYYLKQLRAKKITPGIDDFDEELLTDYAQMCGRVLARAHAKSLQGARICGYMGKSEQFDVAVTKFAANYSDQTLKDYKTLMRAYKEGKLAVS